MIPTAFGIFEIKKSHVTGDARADFIHAKFKQWSYIHLENQFKDYDPKPNFALIRVEFDEDNLLPFSDGKDFVRFTKNRLKNLPDQIALKYI